MPDEGADGLLVRVVFAWFKTVLWFLTEEDKGDVAACFRGTPTGMAEVVWDGLCEAREPGQIVNRGDARMGDQYFRVVPITLGVDMRSRC